MTQANSVSLLWVAMTIWALHWGFCGEAVRGALATPIVGGTVPASTLLTVPDAIYMGRVSPAWDTLLMSDPGPVDGADVRLTVDRDDACADLFISLDAASLCCCMVSDDDTDPPGGEQGVEELIEALGDDAFRVRDEARKVLTDWAAGDQDVLERVRQARSNTDAEVRYMARQIVKFAYLQRLENILCEVRDLLRREAEENQKAKAAFDRNRQRPTSDSAEAHKDAAAEAEHRLRAERLHELVEEALDDAQDIVDEGHDTLREQPSRSADERAQGEARRQERLAERARRLAELNDSTQPEGCLGDTVFDEARTLEGRKDEAGQLADEARQLVEEAAGHSWALGWWRGEEHGYFLHEEQFPDKEGRRLYCDEAGAEAETLVQTVRDAIEAARDAVEAAKDAIDQADMTAAALGGPVAAGATRPSSAVAEDDEAQKEARRQQRATRAEQRNKRRAERSCSLHDD